uniref:3'-5' exonuclease domain-containing protein n=1 Tax=Bursaphelenchus xylophilus TaxID=6326 RepID=A0A1I7SH24_BURXY
MLPVACSTISSQNSSESAVLSTTAEAFFKDLNVVLGNNQNFLKLKKDVAARFWSLLTASPERELYVVYFEILLNVDAVITYAKMDSFANLIRKSLITEFSKFVEYKRESAEGKNFINTAATGLHNLTHLHKKVMEIYFKAKCIQDFKQCMLTMATIDELISFLEEKSYRYVGEVCRWISALPIKSKLDYSVLTARALLNDDLSNLYALCREDVLVRGSVVQYLNYICGDEHIGTDPVVVEEDFGEKHLNEQLRKKISTVVKVAFNMFKEFKLPREAVENCIYIRQMNDFIYVLNRYKRGEINSIEQSIAKAFNKGYRLQYSVLAILAREEGLEVAMYYAMFFNVPEGSWPPDLRENKRNLKALVGAKVEKKREQMDIEQSQIETGVVINTQKDHRAFVVDTIEKIDTILRPFMEEPTEGGYLGMDAEWDASDCGQQGDLCILQLSSRHKTIVVDVTKLSGVLSDEQWIKVLKIIFDGDKKLIGFALHSDLQVLEYKFPFLLEEVPNVTKNMICLYAAFNVINADQEKVRAVYRVPKAPQNNLAQISKIMLNYELSKEEQSSVWSARPLRKEQLRYAAKDSMAVYGIYGLTLSRLGSKFGDVNEIFKPLELTKTAAKKSLMEELEIGERAAEKKTKSSHISKEELEGIVKRVNSFFYDRQLSTISPGQVTYAYDSMCTQLAICLRRLGISVIKVPKEEELPEWIMGNSKNYRILTSGKAIRKFCGVEKVIDTASSSEPLDVQIEMFLKKELLAVDTKSYKPRCEGCNARNFCMIPLPYLQYLHYCTVLQNEEKYSHVELDEDEVERHFESLTKYVYPVMKYQSSFIQCKGKILIYTKNAIIDPNLLEICELIHTKKGTRKGESKKLIMSTHRSLKDLKESRYAVHGICVSCGKENIEVTDDPYRRNV